MKLYNTMSRQVEHLTTLEQHKVRLYSCGLTVYSQPHIGNWLGYLYWDVLVRTLRYDGYDVRHIQNFTDVGHLTSDDDNGEDKMEKGARREGLTAWGIAEKYIGVAMHEGYELLGLSKPTKLIRATDMVTQQIDFAQILDNKGYLYEIADDGMYFDTAKLSDYGKLARLDIAGLAAGARVPVEGKRSITDFAVWKFNPQNTERDMQWDSPWGKGFPGWHLECSAIAREMLGDQIDIHTGGIDHIPVHHANEIAQTETVTGKTFSNVWLHNNHLKVNGTKISKSLGNIYTLQHILDREIPLDAFRVFTFGKHYRTEGNFTWENIEAATNRYNHWREASARILQMPSVQSDNMSVANVFRNNMLEALRNDLDTVRALQHIDEISEQAIAGIIDRNSWNNIIGITQDLLGITISVADISESQKKRINERNQARVAKNWATSDAIRKELLSEGIAVDDTPRGTTWYWKS